MTTPFYTQLDRAQRRGREISRALLFGQQSAVKTGKVPLMRCVAIVLLGLFIIYPISAEIPAGPTGTTIIPALAEDMNQKVPAEIVDPDNWTVVAATSSLNPAATRQTRLTLNKYRGYGLGGRLTSPTGRQLPFKRLARISIYKDGVLWKTMRACGMGFYRLRNWPLPKGTYEARFSGQDNLLPSVSRQVIIG